MYLNLELGDGSLSSTVFLKDYPHVRNLSCRIDNPNREIFSMIKLHRLWAGSQCTIEEGDMEEEWHGRSHGQLTMSKKSTADLTQDHAVRGGLSQ